MRSAVSVAVTDSGSAPAIEPESSYLPEAGYFAVAITEPFTLTVTVHGVT